jgi:S-adenosylmethionine-diacylglycerol 3-amino-3-carboxypropyl transferase
VAVDLSEAQLAALALRIAAFRAMERAGPARFLGVLPDDDRLATYAALRPALPAYARDFWDAPPDAVAAG